MGEQIQIRYLTNEQIDKIKWDACIDTASNGLVYAYSFYLDSMAKNWDALVLGDYEAVMPLTWNKKYGFYYLYQPALLNYNRFQFLSYYYIFSTYLGFHHDLSDHLGFFSFHTNFL